MRVWCGSLLIALLIIFHLQSCETTHGLNVPLMCCFRFYQKRIPVRHIVKFEITRSTCPKAGVIFTTQRGHHVCVDPKQSWVQRAMKKTTQRFKN